MEHENDDDISQQPKIKHKANMTSRNHGMMTPTLIMGRLTSLTCLGMKPECLKSAPSPLSFLDTEVKSKLANGSLLFYFSFFGYLADFRFLVFQFPSAEEHLQEVWPTAKSTLKEYGISCEHNLVSFCKCFFFFFN